MKENRKFIVIATVVLGLLLLVPWKSTVAPPTRVRVFDEAGNPAHGVRVKQEWKYFSVGAKDYTEYARTDEQGFVAFPQRAVRTSLLSKILSIGLEVLTAGHYGMGADAQIWAYGSEPNVWGFVDCSVNVPAPQEIRLKRWDVEMYP